MTVTDEYLKNNERYAAGFSGPLPLPPSKHIAIVACMDARLDVYRALGIQEGEAHVIRNAGGAVSEDVIRSLTISQRLLGTTEIVLIHHTDCGMLTFTDDEFTRAIQEDTGIRPSWAPSRSVIRPRTCGSRSAASSRARSSRGRPRCVASSSTSSPGSSTRSTGTADNRSGPAGQRGSAFSCSPGGSPRRRNHSIPNAARRWSSGSSSMGPKSPICDS